MEFDLENPLTAPEDLQNDTVTALFEKETDHSPFFSFDSDDNAEIRISIRHQAFSLISHAQYCYNLDPFISYLAVNYVDRFIIRTTSLEKKRWVVVILAISSLSLASKMRNKDISAQLSNLLREESIDFDCQTGVHRMEVLILTTLSWRMRSVTPFSFLNYFISFFEFEDSSLPQALKCCASDIIFKSHYEMKLLQFKPSMLAASAFVLATHELIPDKFLSFRDGVSACEYFNKEMLLKCLNIMQETLMDGYALDQCTSTPKSVLDRRASSETGISSTTSDRESGRRRRLSNLCTSLPFHITETPQCE